MMAEFNIDEATRNNYLNLFLDSQSSDNEKRKAAENTFASFVQNKSDELAIVLTWFMFYHEDPQVRSYTAIIFRRMFIKPSIYVDEHQDPVFFNVLKPEVKEHIKDSLISILRKETVYVVRNHLCDLVSDLYTYIKTSENDWVAIPIVVIEFCNHSNQMLRESGLKIIASYPLILNESRINEIVKAFGLTSATDSPTVKLAALKALVALMINSENHLQEKLAVYLPMAFQILETFYKEKDERLLCQGLSSLVELAEEGNSIMVSQIQVILQFCVVLMQDSTLEESSRHMSLELILSVVEGSNVACRAHQEIPTQLIPILLQWMMDVEDTQAQLNSADFDPEEDYDSTFSVGKYGLDRLSSALGGKIILPIAIDYITAMLKSVSWKERYAALVAAGILCEGCRRVMVKDIVSFIKLILPYLHDNHPLVIYITLETIGLFADHLNEDFSDTCHAIVLPALLPLLKNSSMPRLQSHAAAALQNMCECMDKDILEGYMEHLLETLVHLLVNGEPYVRIQALQTISAIAGSAKGNFIPFYDSIMPILFNILENATDKEYRELRGRAVECSSCVALSVGLEKIRPDVENFMNIFQKIQNSVNDDDDPVAEYILEGWTRLAIVLGKEFIPYVDLIAPTLMVAVEIKPEIALVEDGCEDDYPEEEGWRFHEHNGQTVAMQTNMFQEKHNAMDMLTCFAESLQSGFAKYAKKLIPTMLNLFNFFFDNGIRKSAISSIHHLIYCLVDAGTDQDEIDEFKTQIYSRFIRHMRKEEMIEMFNLILEGFHQTIDAVKSHSLSSSDVKNLQKILHPRVEHAISYLNNYSKASQQPGFNEDDIEDYILEEIEFQQEFMITTITFYHTFFKYHGSTYFTTIVPTINLALECFSSLDHHVRQFATGMFDDIVEFGGSDATTFFQGCFVQPMLQLLSDPSAQVRQAVYYGVGVWAKFGGTDYSAACGQAISQILIDINRPYASEGDNQYATDYALATLLKVVQFSPEHIDVNSVLSQLMELLPLRHYNSEVSDTYGYLMDLAKENHSSIVGTPVLQLKLVQILADAVIKEWLDGDQLIKAREIIGVIMNNTDPQTQAAFLNAIPANKHNLFTNL